MCALFVCAPPRGILVLAQVYIALSKSFLAATTDRRFRPIFAMARKKQKAGGRAPEGTPKAQHEDDAEATPQDLKKTPWSPAKQIPALEEDGINQVRV